MNALDYSSSRSGATLAQLGFLALMCLALAVGCRATADNRPDPDDPDPTPPAGSCVDSCGEESPDGCACDSECSARDDCCPDYADLCDSGLSASCEGNCDGTAPSGCGCDDACTGRDDCCADKDSFCSDDPFAGLSDGALVSALRTYTTTGHTGNSYSDARDHMYGITEPFINIHDGVIECIYTGRTAVPDGTRTPGIGDNELNTEHSWPRSHGADEFPAEGDLHHLFPTQQASNSMRSNFDFGETTCTGAACPYFDGGSELGTDSDGQTVFQVRDQFRGDVARAHFYFAVRYNTFIPDDEEAVLQMWNDQDPPDQREIDRNRTIEMIQGNRNPFVDRPELSDRISDF